MNRDFTLPDFDHMGKAQKNYSLTYFNVWDEECHADFVTNEYHNLMELLFDKYIEEWGDCRGRAWCGTCHIEILEGSVRNRIYEDERQTLSKIPNATNRSRLACQIAVNEQVDNMVFRIMETS
ncbi:MAG TPA: 2Fe-2S iron-sulfur cluster-binding protein [Pricia sp.]|nr:2Fe-2S iron-sulfur cluster-binding protein [Pricia sp.]